MFLLLACFNEAINSLLINFASDYFITSNSPFSVTLSEKQSPGSAATGVCVCVLFCCRTCTVLKSGRVFALFRFAVLRGKCFFAALQKGKSSSETTFTVPFKLALYLSAKLHHIKNSDI